MQLRLSKRRFVLYAFMPMAFAGYIIASYDKVVPGQSMAMNDLRKVVQKSGRFATFLLDGIPVLTVALMADVWTTLFSHTGAVTAFLQTDVLPADTPASSHGVATALFMMTLNLAVNLIGERVYDLSTGSVLRAPWSQE